MKLTEIDLNDPAEVRVAIRLLVRWYNETWGDVKFHLREES